MTNNQLLKLLATNRELIQRNNNHAIEHLQMLKADYGHITDCEVALNIELNNSLVEIHFHSNHESAIENSLRAIEKYKDCEFRNLIARHYWLIGQCCANQGQYAKADEYLFLSLKTIVPNEGYIPLKTDVLVTLAMNEEFRNKGAGSSLKYLEEAILLLDHEAYAIRKAGCQMGMGNVYINMGRQEEALMNYHAAAEIYERFFDLANMASVYCNIGTCYMHTKDYTRAEQFLQKSVELRTKFGSPDHLAISYFNLAVVYKETERYQQAFEFLTQSKEILTRTGNQHYLEGAEALLEQITAKLPQLVTV